MNTPRWTAAEAKVQELGAVVKSPQGFPAANPYVAIGQQAQRQMRQWAGELKLTPKTKKAARKVEPEDGDPVLRLLKAR
ncbi:MAG: P27 family phage terminase small subunit [Candidatus Anammoximicrobium sp.]|nr:P27 family phage terminase small subunit [Candidatus Anammoximicrobium sp.]